ncbi:siderophore-interacting protein [Streptomyces sp. DT24]|uniref:siderophore-interacting protein n=1 Tax=unclassified Streptomyces TaxID=2593676 RepID=UPI0023B9F121|nr:siderophore-interacting protein [Streptomyces sp. AM 4-1-1]WEH35877.1 siderophore-interacting protein [Streptomyces sp. AM 4-1-1]
METKNPPTIEVVYHDITVRTLEVLRVTRPTPRMVRVTLGGPELEGFIDRSPADHVKVFFPEPGAELPVLPRIADDGDGLEFPTEPPFPTSRDYTTRRFDAEAGELDLDFVLHGNGVASVWAERARPGMKLGLAGPRGSILVPWEFDWYLFAGDETALPAICRMLEDLPQGAPAKVFLLVDDAQEEHPIDTRADAEIVWLHRNGLRHGEGDLLERAVKGVEFLPGQPFIWVAGEAGELKPIRRYLHRELGLDREYTDVDGFWKRGTVNLDHHEPIEEDD